MLLQWHDDLAICKNAALDHLWNEFDGLHVEHFVSCFGQNHATGFNIDLYATSGQWSMAFVGKNAGVDEAQQQNQPSIARAYRLLLAFNSTTAAIVASGSFIALVLQPLQHRNTG